MPVQGASTWAKPSNSRTRLPQAPSFAVSTRCGSFSAVAWSAILPSIRRTSPASTRKSSRGWRLDHPGPPQPARAHRQRPAGRQAAARSGRSDYSGPGFPPNPAGISSARSRARPAVQASVASGPSSALGETASQVGDESGPTSVVASIDLRQLSQVLDQSGRAQNGEDRPSGGWRRTKGNGR